MKTIISKTLGRLAMAAALSLALAACGQSDSNPDSAGDAVSGTSDEMLTEPSAVTVMNAEAAKAVAVEQAERAKLEAAERVEQLRQERIRQERFARIEGIRRKDPALNWVSVGISTGKFSESIDTTVHRTYAECAEASSMESNSCFPIARLPDSYWNAGR